MSFVLDIFYEVLIYIVRKIVCVHFYSICIQ
jgi:hypothetical protein